MVVAFFLGTLVSLLQPWSMASVAQARNTIEGRVTTEDHQPIKDVRVFLQDDGYSQIGTAYTDSAGRFRFLNLRSGNYYVQIEPDGTDFDRDSQRVEARAFNESRAGGGEVFRVEFVLKPRKGARREGSATSNGKSVVFYQPVPEAAKKEYEHGVKDVEKDAFEGAAASLKKAIEIFPDYYEALELLGTEYVKRKQYEPALPLLSHAVEINRDGWRAFYSLGIGLCGSNKRGDGVKALRRAVDLNPESPNTNMWLGIALAQDKEMRSEAIQTLEKVVRITKDGVPEVYLYLGSLYSVSERYREAVTAFESYLRMAPQTNDREKIKKAIQQLKEKEKANQKPTNK